MSKFCLLTIFLCIIFDFTTSIASAAYTTKLEQQINLIDQEFISTDTTAAPADNSLGLVTWESGKYTGATVFFEAVIKCVNCTGGNTRAAVGLFSASGSLVTGSTVTTLESGYTLVRSGDITGSLSNGTNYTIRATVDADSGAVYVKAARLVIDQNAANITDSQTQIEVGNHTSISTSVPAVMPGPKIFHYDAAAYTAVSHIYFEATASSSDPDGVLNVSLSASTDCSTSVAESNRSISGTTWTLSRSGPLTLTDNTDYWVCLYVTDGFTGNLASAKVIIDQSDAGGIYRFRLHHTLVNTTVIDNDDSYTSQEQYYQYTPSSYGANSQRDYFETDTNTNGGTAYTRLFNLTDASTVTGSELSTGSNGYIRLISDDLHHALPTGTKILDTQLRNSSTAISAESASWLVIELERILDPAISFTVTGIGAFTTNNGITTSIETTFDTLPFGDLFIDTPKYAAQSLYASTNAVSGYTVTMKMLQYLQGLYPGNNIDPFTASWDTPAAWSTPDGDTPNDNTGWIGANTTDTRVAGWSDGNQKFGAVSNAPQTVMFASGPDAGTTTVVTYALEVNVLQPADAYQGSLVYNILPTY